VTRHAAAILALALVVVVPGAVVGAGRDVRGMDAGVAPIVGPAPVAAPLPAPPGRTSLLSQARGGGFPDNGSLEPSTSTNGRFVAFTSIASDLVAGDVTGSVEVFLLDRRSGKTIRVPLPPGESRSAAASQSQPSISGDGRVVAYTWRPETFEGVVRTYVVAWDRSTGKVDYVSRNEKGTRAFGASDPSVSGDGRYVAYTTTADFAREVDQGIPDVFRYDRQTGLTQVLSVGPEGRPIAGSASSPSISGDGNLVAFLSDGGDTIVHENTGPGLQVYVRDVAARVTTRVSAAANGGPARDTASDPAISADGRFVAFGSRATNLTPEGAGGLFRRDLATGATILVSVRPDGGAGTGTSGQPSITTNGAMVAWASNAPDLVPETAGAIAPAATTTRGATEVFIRDIDAGETVLVSVTLANAGAKARSFEPAIAGGGRFIAFASDSPSLVRGDGNKTYDVFLRDLPPVPVLNPSTLDLGSRAVGTTSLPLAATLGNAGWTPLRVVKATITGTNRGDFALAADGCAGRVLRRNEACTVTVTFKPRAKGTRAATLAVADTFAGSPRTVRLRGRASEGRLVVDPPIGDPGLVTIATGSGFPPDTALRLSWSRGITPKMPDVVTDSRGSFRVQVLIFHNDLTGLRQLVAKAADRTAFPTTTAPMLVTKPSVIPPRFDIIRIIDLPLVLVFRG
jgi:Tol biopolymer transport system component